jgi:hypothetical protein
MSEPNPIPELPFDFRNKDNKKRSFANMDEGSVVHDEACREFERRQKRQNEDSDPLFP